MSSIFTIYVIYSLFCLFLIFCSRPIFSREIVKPHHFDLPFRALFKPTTAFVSYVKDVTSGIHPFCCRVPNRAQQQSRLQPESLRRWTRYRSIGNNESLKPAWAKSKWPVLWKQPLKTTAWFPMGRAMSPARPPVRHLQEAKRSEYFPGLQGLQDLQGQCPWFFHGAQVAAAKMRPSSLRCISW